nr:uncharacterized protein LOC117609912 [Osmia lignaria]
MAQLLRTTDKWSEIQSDDSQETLEVSELNPSPRTSSVLHLHATRASLPATLPIELQLKVRTQMGRLTSIQDVHEAVIKNSGDLSMEELADLKAQIEEALKAFNQEHAYLEVVWPTSMAHHEYFEANCHLQMQRACSAVKRFIAKEKASLLNLRSTQQLETLPVISLPKFTGSYTDWPPFFELFSSMILTNTRLQNVEKFYYLKRCLEGEPAQLISNLPLTDASLQSALEQLRTRYENKRLLIQAHLDQLLALPATKHHSARLLNQLLTAAIENRNAVLNLVDPNQLADCILVHQVSSRLDGATKKMWESSLEATNEYPTFDQLTQFATSRVRILERLEADQNKSAQPQSKQAPPPEQPVQPARIRRTISHQAVPRASPYEACDCCGRGHYIVACSQFRRMSIKDRFMCVQLNRLCYNCLGRHPLKACKTTRECKLCSTRHHTMLHGSEVAFMTTSTQPPASHPKQRAGSSQAYSFTSPGAR